VSPVVFRGDGEEFSIFDLRIAIERVAMTEAQMIARTKQFALRILRLVDALPNSRAGRIIADQLGRSGTSVGANYRAACRGRSKAEFLAKLGVVEEEADESLYWLELIVEGKILKPSRVALLRREAHEIVAIVASSRKTTARSLATNGQPNRNSQIANRN
jgi:four helix bundle protein